MPKLKKCWKVVRRRYGRTFSADDATLCSVATPANWWRVTYVLGRWCSPRRRGTRLFAFSTRAAAVAWYGCLVGSYEGGDVAVLECETDDWVAWGGSDASAPAWHGQPKMVWWRRWQLGRRKQLALSALKQFVQQGDRFGLAMPDGTVLVKRLRPLRLVLCNW